MLCTFWNFPQETLENRFEKEIEFDKYMLESWVFEKKYVTTLKITGRNSILGLILANKYIAETSFRSHKYQVILHVHY